MPLASIASSVLHPSSSYFFMPPSRSNSSQDLSTLNNLQRHAQKLLAWRCSSYFFMPPSRSNSSQDLSTLNNLQRHARSFWASSLVGLAASATLGCSPMTFGATRSKLSVSPLPAHWASASATYCSRFSSG